MDREAFVGQVANAMTVRILDLEQYLGTPQGGLRTAVYSRAQELAEALEDPRQAPSAARAVMSGMWGHSQTEVPKAFWSTEAGQAVARAIGYHREAVPYVAAAAILGVTRQRVYQLCEEGHLTRVRGQNAVLPGGVRQVLLNMGGGR